MTKDLPLFRSQVRDSRNASVYGEILVIRPLSFALITAISMTIALCLVGFFVFGTYTRRSTLAGELVPTEGIVKVYTSQFGTILERHVAEGQSVKRGDVLFVISSDTHNTAGDTQAMITQQATKRLLSLQEDIRDTASLLQSERRMANDQLANLQQEIKTVEQLIGAMKRRVQLASDTQSRYEGLQQQGFVSLDQLRDRQSDYLDQQTRLETLERDRIGLQRQIDEQRATLEQLGARYRTQVSTYERAITTTEDDISRSEALRRLTVVAPKDGVVTAIVGDMGQSVDSTRPLLSIVPKSVVLQADLFAPSRAIGFISPGDTVYLRYEAYPYQKFGHHRGTVVSVSTVALSRNELASGSVTSPSLVVAASGEPVYRVTVRLDSQSINGSGGQRILQTGMRVDADVLHERRRLYEWTLEPLLSVTEKLH